MRFGLLAAEYCGMYLPLMVCRSSAGYYIGTMSNELGPVSRESVEYYPTWKEANNALRDNTFTQRYHP